VPKPKSTLTFQIPENEKATLLEYCKQEQRTQSDVLRELVRSLKQKLHAEQKPSFQDGALDPIIR
jgi:hypothetical protein